MSESPFDGEHSAPAFQVVKASRRATPALVALWGYSDSGKTYSALRLARGLVGPKGKIAFIDTENQRALYYADKFGEWLHVDLQPPFTAQRYMAAFDAAVRAGANAVVVDSFSHVWQGEGGVLEQADSSTAGGLAKWKNPKTQYNKLRNSLLRAPVHMVFCLRAKEKFLQTGSGKSAEIKSVGDVPVADKMFIYEVTVACHMAGDGDGRHKPLPGVKIPEDIKHAIKPGEYITEESGRLIAEWFAGGAPVDQELAALLRAARLTAADGSTKFRDWWQTLDKKQKLSLKPSVPELKDIADVADAEAAKAVIEGANSGDSLADPFTPQPKEAAAA